MVIGTPSKGRAARRALSRRSAARSGLLGAREVGDDDGVERGIMGLDARPAEIEKLAGADLARRNRRKRSAPA